VNLEVNVPEVFEVFKEICAAPEKLFDMMRLNLKEIAELPHRPDGMGVDHPFGPQTV
jgi:hypothetical protein